MSLMREIYAQIAEGEEGFAGLSYTVWAGKGGYFQDIKNVISFSPEKLELKTRGGKLTITGRNLTVRKYVEEDLSLGGAILSVTQEEGGG